MKVKVITCFTDKYTKEIYRPGQELEITKKRFNEIRKANKAQRPDLVWVEEIPEEAEPEEATEE